MSFGYIVQTTFFVAFLNTSFSSWRIINESHYYQDKLNPIFWTKKGGEYFLDPIVRKKILNIAEDFYKKYNSLAKNVEIEDIQLTGSLANYNYTTYSDLDIHVLLDLSKVHGSKDEIRSAVDEIRFIWNINHNIKIREHDVEIYVQDYNNQHQSTGLYSVLNDEWIKKPKHSHPSVSDEDVEEKYRIIATDIERLERKLLSSQHMPSNAKDLYQFANKIKRKIMKMKAESLEKGGEFSVGNLSFKKLKDKEYIGRLNDVISLSYDKVYDRQK